MLQWAKYKKKYIILNIFSLYLFCMLHLQNEYIGDFFFSIKYILSVIFTWTLKVVSNGKK